MIRTLSIIAGLSVLVTGGMLVHASTDKKPGAILKADDPQIVSLGEGIYMENCAACHGDNLEGQPNWRRPGPDGLMPAPPHNETGHTWHHTDDVLFGITKYGLAKFAGLKDYKSAMPVYEDVLTDDEIIAALSFIKAQWAEDIRAAHDEMNAARAGQSE